MDEENLEDETKFLKHPSINYNSSLELDVIKRNEICDGSYMTKRRTLWNLFIISFSYFLSFSGFWGLSNLQSTMNAAEGIGPDSQAVIYGASLVSSLLLSEISIENCGCRTVLIVTTILGFPYVAANMYLRWDLMLSTSALIGLTSGPYSAALTVYIDEIAIRFHKQSTQDLEYVVSWFFGIYVLFMEGTQISGNAIAYFVLSEKHCLQNCNYSMPTKCGIEFDASENVTNANMEPPTDHERMLLVGIYLVMAFLSLVLLCLFLDPLKNDIKEGSGWYSACNRLLGTIKHLRFPHQILLIPLTIYMGVESVFYSNEFTEAYIACSWGVHHVGFVTICFGVCGALMSLLVGPLVKCISQMAVLLLAACANVAMCIVLYLWHPSPDNTTIYFVIAGVWGMGDAIWWSQVTALYGLMFPNNREAAFSNLYFWSFLGFFISYSYANYLSVAVKINILLVFLGTGIAGYLAGQIKIKCTARKEYVTIEETQE